MSLPITAAEQWEVGAALDYDPMETPVTDGEVTLSMAIPVDSDGFLRRECPTCERESSGFPRPRMMTGTPWTMCATAATSAHTAGCRRRLNAWLTKAQIAHAQRIAEAEVVEPMLAKFADDITRKFRSAGITTRSAPRRHAEVPDPLTEDDDMTRVGFACHPSEPVKIFEDWHEPAHCLICGAPNP